MVFQKNKKEILLIILSFAGLALSFLLLVVDLNNMHGIANKFCIMSDYVNCDKVASSAFAHVGPIPVSVIGMFFYFFVIFFAIFTKNPPAFFKTLSWFFLLASVFSLFLMGVSFFYIKSLCIFCMGTYLVNWIILFILRKDLSFDGVFTKTNILVALLAVVLSVGFTLGSYFILKTRTKPTYNQIITNYQKTPTTYVNTLYTPYYGASNPKINIVVYSDFFCSFCQQFSLTLEQITKKEEYKDLVRVYYKLYPMEKECNSNIKGKGYEGSCILSALALDFNKQGLFWEYEKLIRTQYFQGLDKEKGIALAKNLSRTPLNLEKVKANNYKFLHINAQEGQSMGITGTPVWFINGKKMDGALDAQGVIMLLEYIKDHELKSE